MVERFNFHELLLIIFKKKTLLMCKATEGNDISMEILSDYNSNLFNFCANQWNSSNLLNLLAGHISIFMYNIVPHFFSNVWVSGFFRRHKIRT